MFTPVEVGRYSLPNRLVMAPMICSRAADAGVPSELAPVYYGQRAGVNLIITEGTSPSPMAKGYRLKFSMLSIMKTFNSLD